MCLCVWTDCFAAQVLRICAHGLVLHRDAYLRNPWNVLDFVIAITSVLALSVEDLAIGAWGEPLLVLRPSSPPRLGSVCKGSLTATTSVVLLSLLVVC